VGSLDRATRFLVNAGLYITLNDGTLARASYAAANPLRCFSSGPTNSARGAAFLAREMVLLSGSAAGEENEDGRDLLVIDVGGTTTDVCSLLPNGYPRQSAACVRVSGVKTNFSMPDVHSIALGAGSVIRGEGLQILVGPDSVALEESTKALHAGGPVFTVSLVYICFRSVLMTFLVHLGR
jgi:N-methylhydantoinase A/oxoprolinase/acetone carboxylase beta subunit